MQISFGEILDNWQKLFS